MGSATTNPKAHRSLGAGVVKPLSAPAETYGLSRRQRELLTFLELVGGDASHAEMRQAIGVAGRGPVDQLLDQLERRGFIRRKRYQRPFVEILQPLPIVINGERYRFIAKTVAA